MGHSSDSDLLAPSPASVLLPGEPTIVVVGAKADDLDLWIVYVRDRSLDDREAGAEARLIHHS